MSCTPKSKGLEVVLSARAPRAAATSRKGLQARWFFIGARRLSESPSASFPEIRKSSSIARAFTFTFTFNRHRGKFYWLVMAGRYLSVSIQAFNLKFSCVSIQAFNLKFSCRSGRGPVSSDTPETSKKQTPKFLLTISSSFR